MIFQDPALSADHLKHIYLKAGVTNRTGASLVALEHGIAGNARDEAVAPWLGAPERAMIGISKGAHMNTETVISLSTGLEDAKRPPRPSSSPSGPPKQNAPP